MINARLTNRFFFVLFLFLFFGFFSFFFPGEVDTFLFGTDCKKINNGSLYSSLLQEYPGLVGSKAVLINISPHL